MAEEVKNKDLPKVNENSKQTQKDLARPNQERGDELPAEKGTGVPNPVPAHPKGKEADAIKDATPGLAQAVTTLNPHARRQEPNLVADVNNDADTPVVNINGQNIEDQAGYDAHDSNFAAHFQRLAADPANNPIANDKDGRSKKELRDDQREAKNTNFANDFIKESNDEANNPIVNGEAPKFDKDTLKKAKETQEEYNERVTPGEQPVQPPVTFTYLGEKR